MTQLTCQQAKLEQLPAVMDLAQQCSDELQLPKTTIKSSDAFVVMLDNEVIALAIKGESLEQHTLAMLYVLPQYRRQGYGSMLARYVFRQFAGDWQIKVGEQRSELNQFWQSTLAQFEYGFYDQTQIIDPVDDLVELHTFSVL